MHGTPRLRGSRRRGRNAISSTLLIKDVKTILASRNLGSWDLEEETARVRVALDETKGKALAVVIGGTEGLAVDGGVGFTGMVRLNLAAGRGAGGDVALWDGGGKGGCHGGGHGEGKEGERVLHFEMSPLKRLRKVKECV